MHPFFRKIRWRLARDNQFFKYSRYAIGEIVLVVIGILIALQVNNWNEQRKNTKEVLKILLEVQNDLLMNIENIEITIRHKSTQDSLISSFLTDTLTLNDLKTDKRLLYLSGYFISSVLYDEGFIKLQVLEKSIPLEHNQIYTDLKNLFGQYDHVLSREDKLAQLTFDHNKYFVNNHKWFYKLKNGHPYDEDAASSFLLSDSTYKNMLAQYRFLMDDINYFYLKHFSIKTYYSLSHFTKVNSLPENYQRLFETDLIEFGGTYKSKIVTAEDHNKGLRKVRNTDGILYWDGYQCFNTQTKDSFAFYNNNTVFFQRDSLGKIIGATRYWRGKLYNFEKID